MEWQGQIPLLKPLGFNDSKTNINGVIGLGVCLFLIMSEKAQKYPKIVSIDSVFWAKFFYDAFPLRQPVFRI